MRPMELQGGLEMDARKCTVSLKAGSSQPLTVAWVVLGFVGQTGSCWWPKQKTKGRPKQTAPDPLAGAVLDVISGMSWQTQ